MSLQSNVYFDNQCYSDLNKNTIDFNYIKGVKIVFFKCQ